LLQKFSWLLVFKGSLSLNQLACQTHFPSLICLH
jgi:hypothetical protein